MSNLAIDTERLRVLAPTEWNAVCSVCSRPRARWELNSSRDHVVAQSWVPVCALCFLYETNWGKNRAALLSAFLLEDVPRTTKRVLVVTEGQVTTIEDADFVLGLLAWASRRIDLLKGTA